MTGWRTEVVKNQPPRVYRTPSYTNRHESDFAGARFLPADISRRGLAGCVKANVVGVVRPIVPTLDPQVNDSCLGPRRQHRNRAQSFRLGKT